MIIVDDTVSVHTLVGPSNDELAQRTIPRYLLPLTYTSLGFSIVPFILALINVSASPLHSIPTAVAYVLTAPFNIATLLVMWHIIRETVWIPFNITSKKTISFTIFLQITWILSAIMSGLMVMDQSTKVRATFTALTISAVLQVLLLGAIFCIIMLDYLRKRAARRRDSDSATSSTTKGPRMIGV